MTIETAEQCFQRLLNERKSTKFRLALESVKRSCDEINSFKGLINFTKVADYATSHFGGPKYSTIMNDPDGHKLYIKARISDIDSKEKNKKVTVHSKLLYPSDGLDDKTKCFIDELRRDKEFTSKINETLEAQINLLTKAVPISFSAAIQAGPNDDLSMKLIESTENTVPSIFISNELKSALRKVLALPEAIGPPLYLKGNSLIWETPSQEVRLLLPREWQSIVDMVSNDDQ